MVKIFFHLLCFTFLISFAIGWKPGQLYLFNIEARNVAGLPDLKDQYSGIDINGTLSLQVHDPTTFLLKFSNMTSVKLHGRIEKGWWNGNTIEQAEPNSEPFPLSQLPFVIQIQKNVVKKIIVSKDLKDWEVNFIKGIINHLLLSVSLHGGSKYYTDNGVQKSRMSPEIKNINSYSSIEDSVIGRCEAMYDVVKIPHGTGGMNDLWNHPLKKSLCGHKHIYEVTRTYNFNNCEFLAETHFNFPYTPANSESNCKPGGSNCGNFWKRSSLTRATGCGDSNGFILLDSVTSSSMDSNVQIHEGTTASVRTKLNISLQKILPKDNSLKSNLAKSTNHIHDLIYQYTPVRSNVSPLCNSNFQEHQSVKQNDDDIKKKISEILFNDFNVKTKDAENHRPKRSDEDGNLFMKRKSDDRSKIFASRERITESHNSYNNSEYKKFYANNYDDMKKNTQLNYEDEQYPHKKEDSEEKINKNFNKEKDFRNYNVKSSEKDIWNPLSDEISEPPFMPLTPFSLANKEGDARNCLSNQLKNLIEEIADEFVNKDILVETGTMRKISIAIDMCQLLSFKELITLSESLSYPWTSIVNSKTAVSKRNLFKDILTSCGTKPALSVIGKWIDDDLLSPDEITSVFTYLPSKLMSGDKKTIQFYFNLVRKISDNKFEPKSIAAVIGFSNFLRISCLNTNSKNKHFNSHVEEMGDENDAEQYIEWMAEKLKTDNSKIIRVYTLAIGNTGCKSAVNVLSSIVNNQNLSNYQRSNAIIAMKYLTLYHPKNMEPILFGIYSDYSAPVSVRISALSLLLFSYPSLTVWQRIAISTWYEPNYAVVDFIHSSISSLSFSFEQNPNSIYKDMDRSASLVKHLMKPKSIYREKPLAHNIISSSFMREIGSVIYDHSSWISTADFISVYHRNSARMHTFTSNYEMEFSVANIDELLQSIRTFIFPVYEDNSYARPPIQGLKRSTSWIHQKLGLTPKKPSPLEGDIHFRVNDLMEMILPFDSITFESLPELKEKLIIDLVSHRLNFDLQWTDVSSTVLSTTTELGLPIRLQIRVPSVYIIKIDTKLISRSAVNVNASFKYSSGMDGELGFFSPWDNTFHSAGVRGSCFGQIPNLNMNVEVNFGTSLMTVKTEPIKETKILSHTTQPFTSQKDLTSSQILSNIDNIRLIHFDSMKEQPINLMPYFNGSFKTEGELQNYFDFFNNLKLVGYHPMMRHSNKLTEVEINMVKIGPVISSFRIEKATINDGQIFVDRNHINYETVLKSDQPRKIVARSIWSRLFGWGSDDTTTTTEMPMTTTPALNDNSDITSAVPDVPSSPENKTENINEVKLETVSRQINKEAFNASIIDPFGLNDGDSSLLYLMRQSSDGMSGGQVSVIDVNSTIILADGKTESYSGFGIYASTNSKSVQRIGYFIKEKNSNWQNRFTATLEKPPLPVYNLNNEFLNGTQPKFSGDFFNKYNEYNYSILFQGIIERNVDVYNLEQDVEACERPKTAATLKCRMLYHLLTSSIGVKFNISINNGIKGSLLNLTNFAKLATLLGTKNLLEIDTDKKEINVDISKVLQISMELDKTYSYWNTWINLTNNYYKKVPVPVYPAVSTGIAIFKELIQENWRYCGIRDDKILTFDGMELNYNMSECWHLAAKDCSGKSRIFVLTRALKNSTFMDLEINLDNYKIIRITEKGIVVNDESITLLPNNVAAVITDKVGTVLSRIERTIDYALDIMIPDHGFKITYTNTSVIIYANSGMQNRLRGLCGDFNQETFGELQSPHGVLYSSVEDYGLSYIADENCI